MFETKRRVLSEQLSNFFDSIGIDPTLGFIGILSLIITFRVKEIISEKKTGYKDSWEKIVGDVLTVLITGLLIYLYFTAG